MQVNNSSTEQQWKQKVKWLWNSFFTFIWLGSLSFFALQLWLIFMVGAEQPTSMHTIELVDRSVTVYITPLQEQIRSILRYFLVPGIPLVVLSGAILQWRFGIPVFIPEKWSVWQRKA